MEHAELQMESLRVLHRQQVSVMQEMQRLLLMLDEHSIGVVMERGGEQIVLVVLVRL